MDNNPMYKDTMDPNEEQICTACTVDKTFGRKISYRTTQMEKMINTSSSSVDAIGVGHRMEIEIIDVTIIAGLSENNLHKFFQRKRIDTHFSTYLLMSDLTSSWIKEYMYLSINTKYE